MKTEAELRAYHARLAAPDSGISPEYSMLTVEETGVLLAIINGLHQTSNAYQRERDAAVERYDGFRESYTNERETIADEERAIAEAREQALRAVLSEALGDGHNLKAFAGTMLRWGEPGVDVSDEARRVVEHAEKWHRIISAALAAPVDDSALREFGLKVARLAADNSPPMAPHEVVRAVLRGQWSGERIIDTGDGPHVTQIGSEPMPVPKPDAKVTPR